MYRPPHFVQDDIGVLASAIRDIQFAALVTPTPDGIQATHVPMVVHPGKTAAETVLETHVARPNPHWRAATDAPSLAIFQGPQAYVSPSWYPSKAEHGKVVPTWTYVTVHAHGRLEAIHDEAWLARHLDELTRQNEAGRDEPWEVTDAPPEFIGALSRGIVGLRLTLTRLEGAWKLNQHKTVADREGTARGLAQSGEMGARLAALADPAADA